MLDKQRFKSDHARVKNVTHLHYIFYDGCPSGKIVRFLMGTITSSGFAREQTGLERRAEATISKPKYRQKDRSEKRNKT